MSMSVSANIKSNNNEDWIDLNIQPIPEFCNEGTQIDTTLMKYIFPTKENTKLNKWISSLRSEEFETLKDLSVISSEMWDQLSLPLSVKGTLKDYAMKCELIWQERRKIHQNSIQSTNQQLSIPTILKPVDQIDCIVMDISASMKARSILDVDKTREDVSKMLFHTLIDKLITLELSHAVGLLAFGQNITPIDITRGYETFHDQLGRLDATEGSTKLYDAIFEAGNMIEEYIKTNNIDDTTPNKIWKRIFVLTDGEDNSSQRLPWEVAQSLQQKSIILDAIPLASNTKTLQSMCSSTLGLCFEVVDQEQAMQLFETDATLHVAYRKDVEEWKAAESAMLQITDAMSLASLEKTMAVTQISSAVNKKVYEPCIKPENLTKLVSTTSIMNGAVKRLMREYDEVMKQPIDGIKVFVLSSSIMSWKVILSNLPAPYEGGTWLLTVQCRDDYPFSPPKIAFVTPIYHCNVSVNGQMCLGILQHEWNPALSISKALQHIRDLMLQPNPNDAIDVYKGVLFRDDPNKYNEEAQKHTKEKASESYESFRILYNLE